MTNQKGQKRAGHQKNNDTVWQVSHAHHSLRYNRSLTTITLQQNKKDKKKGTRHQTTNDTPRQTPTAEKENNTNSRLKRTNHQKTQQVIHIHQTSSTPIQKGRTTQEKNSKNNKKDLLGLPSPINPTGST